MKTEVVTSETPEQAELKRKKQEPVTLETKLAERELGLGTLEAEPRAFERRYLRTVGAPFINIIALRSHGKGTDG